MKVQVGTFCKVLDNNFPGDCVHTSIFKLESSNFNRCAGDCRHNVISSSDDHNAADGDGTPLHQHSVLLYHGKEWTFHRAADYPSLAEQKIFMYLHQYYINLNLTIHTTIRNYTKMEN